MRSLTSLAIMTIALAGCAAQQPPRPAPGPAAPGDPVEAGSDMPIDAAAATLHVKGLSCPLCATNIDKQLARVPGVQTVHADLATGEVYVEFDAKQRPSPAALARAVVDSGFTLDRIEVH